VRQGGDQSDAGIDLKVVSVQIFSERLSGGYLDMKNPDLKYAKTFWPEETGEQSPANP
jgi:hypothetical protein